MLPMHLQSRRAGTRPPRSSIRQTAPPEPGQKRPLLGQLGGALLRLAGVRTAGHALHEGRTRAAMGTDTWATG